MMPPFVVFPTNRIAHFVEVSLYLFYLAQRVKLYSENNGVLGQAKKLRGFLLGLRKFLGDQCRKSIDNNNHHQQHNRCCIGLIRMQPFTG